MKNSVKFSSACYHLAYLSEKIVAENPQISAREYILTLGEQTAGIRRGVWGIFDLLRGGKDLVPGGGFKAEFDDKSAGQVRHFMGIAVSSLVFGPKLTVWLSEKVRRDPANTPDGRLTLASVDFTKRLIKGELSVNEAGQWVCENLCSFD